MHLLENHKGWQEKVLAWIRARQKDQNKPLSERKERLSKMTAEANKIEAHKTNQVHLINATKDSPLKIPIK